jgi:hypothetical protein
MTLTVSTPHPWPVGHFEGTDRSFPLYAAFPRSEYYGRSDALMLIEDCTLHIRASHVHGNGLYESV